MHLLNCETCDLNMTEKLTEASSREKSQTVIIYVFDWISDH